MFLFSEEKHRNQSLENEFNENLEEKDRFIENQTQQIRQLQSELKDHEKKLKDKDESIEHIQKDHSNQIQQLQSNNKILQQQLTNLQNQIQVSFFFSHRKSSINLFFFS